MKLRHFSKYPIKKLKPVLMAERDSPNSPRLYGAKPLGLWLSDERKAAYGWRAWCTAEAFRLDTFKYEYAVKLKPEARILHLTTAEDIDEFTLKYRDHKSFINKSVEHIGPKFGFPPSTHEIDWPAVAKQYQGIVITPYVWSRRLHPGCDWYYVWDCASGCIWDTGAIESFKLVTQHEVPRKRREVSWAVQQRRVYKAIAQLAKQKVKNDAKAKG